jgi:hypothetical protein
MFGIDFRDFLEDILDWGDSDKCSLIHQQLLQHHYQKENVTILEGHYDTKTHHFNYSRKVEGRFFCSFHPIDGDPKITLAWIGEDGEVSGVFLREADIVKVNKRPIPSGEKTAFWIRGRNKDWFILRNKVAEAEKKSLLRELIGIVDVIKGTDEKAYPKIAAIKKGISKDFFYLSVNSIKGETVDGNELFQEDVFKMEVVFEKGILLIVWINKNTEQVGGIWLQDKDIVRLDEEVSDRITYRIFTENVVYTFVRSMNPKRKK